MLIASVWFATRSEVAVAKAIAADEFAALAASIKVRPMACIETPFGAITVTFGSRLIKLFALRLATALASSTEAMALPALPVISGVRSRNGTFCIETDSPWTVLSCSRWTSEDSVSRIVELIDPPAPRPAKLLLSTLEKARVLVRFWIVTMRPAIVVGSAGSESTAAVYWSTRLTVALVVPAEASPPTESPLADAWASRIACRSPRARDSYFRS